MIRNAYGCSVLLVAVLALGGCQALTGAGGDIADGARARVLAWWESEGRESAKREAGALAEAAKDRAIEEATRIGSTKLREAEERLAGSGVDAKSIDSLAKAWEAYRKIQEEEKRSGKPYTGNSLLDIALALFASRYAGKMTDRGVAKLMKPETKG